MGVGIGGDYPLSAVISSEFASTRTRGRLMTAVFAFQGWGNFGIVLPIRLSISSSNSDGRLVAAALVGLIVVAAYKDGISHDSYTALNHVDYCWRLLIGLGCVPGTIALYFRLTIPETPRFTMDIERNVQQAAEDIDNVVTRGTFYVDPDAVIQRVEAPRASRRDFAKYYSQWKNFKVLFGASYSWFALDVSGSIHLRLLHLFTILWIFRSLTMDSASTRVLS
jgi:PHS family inorganic phosphate transporter-like MFS transporter